VKRDEPLGADGLAHVALQRDAELEELVGERVGHLVEDDHEGNPPAARVVCPLLRQCRDL
jgi:hypothetical protein